MQEFLAAAVAMCREAGAIHLAQLGKAHDIAYKGPANLVTEVDKQAESVILAHISREFPDHAVVAEESGRHAGRDGTTAGGPEHVWYVDPLDGTTNYAHAFPMFGVSIALYRRGEPLVSAIFNAALGELFTAARRSGAWLNDRPIRVSQAPDLAHSLVATGFSPEVREDLHNIDEFIGILRRAQAVRRPGAASIDLAYVACGRFDGFWEYRLSPWDVAAGRLLVEEAGGRVTAIDGSRFEVEAPPRAASILATNGLIHEEMQEVLASTPRQHQDRVS